MLLHRRAAILPLIGVLLCAGFVVVARASTVPAGGSGHAVVAQRPIITEVSSVLHDATYPSPHGHGYFCSSTLATPYQCGDADTPYTDNPTFYRWQRGHYSGPSWRTSYGQATIVGFHDCGPRHCPTVDVSYHPPARTTADPMHDCGSIWNPLSWCWSDIFGSIWDDFLGPCLTGALDGFIGTASGQVIVNLLNRGGQVFMDPWGYVAIAFGNCLVNVIHKAAGQ